MTARWSAPPRPAGTRSPGICATAAAARRSCSCPSGCTRRAAAGQGARGAAARPVLRHAHRRRRGDRGRRLGRQPEPQLGEQAHRSLRVGPGRRVRRGAGRVPRVLDGAAARRAGVDAVDEPGRAAAARRDAGVERPLGARCGGPARAGATRSSGAAGAPYDWRIETADADAGALALRIWADPADFVALRYDDPPGGAKICLNSKIARCELTLRRGGQTIGAALVAGGVRDPRGQRAPRRRAGRLSGRGRRAIAPCRRRSGCGPGTRPSSPGTRAAAR